MHRLHRWNWRNRPFKKIFVSNNNLIIFCKQKFIIIIRLEVTVASFGGDFFCLCFDFVCLLYCILILMFFDPRNEGQADKHPRPWVCTFQNEPKCSSFTKIRRMKVFRFFAWSYCHLKSENIFKWFFEENLYLEIFGWKVPEKVFQVLRKITLRTFLFFS